MTMIHSPIDRDQLPATVRQLVGLVAPSTTVQVTDEARMIADLGFHSLAQAELAFMLEDLFGLDAITPETAMGLERVGDVTALICGVIDGGTARLPAVEDVKMLCAQYGTDWQEGTA